MGSSGSPGTHVIVTGPHRTRRPDRRRRWNVARSRIGWTGCIGCMPERSGGCVPERTGGCVPERSGGCMPERSDSPIRPRADDGPCADGRRRSPGRPASTSDGGTRAAWHGGGCWAGRGASRLPPRDSGECRGRWVPARPPGAHRRAPRAPGQVSCPGSPCRRRPGGRTHAACVAERSGGKPPTFLAFPFERGAGGATVPGRRDRGTRSGPPPTSLAPHPCKQRRTQQDAAVIPRCGHLCG